MEIQVDRDMLNDALGRARRVLPTRAAIPVMQGILCEAAGETLTVTGGDVDVSVRVETEAEVVEGGDVVVPGKLFVQAMLQMPAGTITVRTTDRGVRISGESPRPVFTLRPMEDAYQRVSVDVPVGAELDGEALAGAVKQVVPCASTDLGRATLTGVFFESDEERLRLVATDSYRLGLRDLPSVGLEQTGIFPARGLRELPNTVGAATVTAGFDSGVGVFGSEGRSLRLRMIEGNFPNYENIVASEFSHRFVCDKAALLESLRRVILVAEDHYPVRLVMANGGAEIGTVRQDLGQVTDYVEGEFEGDSETTRVAFNPRYLTDGVNAAGGEKVRVSVVDGSKPSRVDDPDEDGFLYMVMPVNV